VPAPSIQALPLFGLVALAAMGFQTHANLNAAPRYLQDSSATELPWLLPIFWLGFHIALTQAGRIARATSSLAAFTLGCSLSAGGALISYALPGLTPAAVGQFTAGIGWGFALSAAFGLVGQIRANRAREGSLIGVLFAVLALATFLRLGVNASGLAHSPSWQAWLPTFPVLAWVIVALIAGLVARARGKT